MNWAIDENVLAVANDISRSARGEAVLCAQAGDSCRLACVDFLNHAIRHGTILIDSNGLVLSYYRRKASMSGQPGSADAFLKELHLRSYSGDVVRQIDIDPPPEFGLPTGFINSGFDADDRIYVALAKSIQDGTVVNAVDSDYSIFQEDLKKLGVPIRELCPERPTRE